MAAMVFLLPFGGAGGDMRASARKMTKKTPYGGENLRPSEKSKVARGLNESAAVDKHRDDRSGIFLHVKNT